MKKNEAKALAVSAAGSGTSVQSQKLTVEEFVLTAIEKLADPGRQTVHTVYSGFNDAFRDYFGKDPIVEVKTLVEQGKISFRFCRGGALIAKPGVIGDRGSESKDTLKKMGLS
jgi:hypothetical protein